jgi:hypothetical protein
MKSFGSTTLCDLFIILPEPEEPEEDNTSQESIIAMEDDGQQEKAHSDISQAIFRINIPILFESILAEIQK